MTATEPPATAGPGMPRRYVRSSLVKSLGIGMFLAVVIIYFSLRTSNFLSLSNISDVPSGVAVLGIVAIGQTGVIISGGFDLSVAGVLPIACVLFVKFSNDGSSLTQWGEYLMAMATPSRMG